MQENNPISDPALQPDTLTSAEATSSAATNAPDMAELLRLAEIKSQEHQDAWLRAKAETENVRRRAQEDIAKTHKFATERFATELLTVKDSLEAALANENQDIKKLKSGVDLTLRQLCTAFEKSGIVEVNPMGEKFDPHKHQAIGQLDAPDGVEANHVLQVLQKGYLLHDRTIRPALVMVSKPAS